MYRPNLDPTAVTGRRIGAWVIDFAFAGVLVFIAMQVAIEGYSDIPGNLCDDESTDSATEADEVFCRTELLGREGWAIYDENGNTTTFFESDGLWTPFAAFVGYGIFTFVLVEGLVGGSLGKLILGLRVVKADGSHAGIGRSTLRFLMWIVDAFPYCFPLVGLIAGLSTKGHRRLGDMVAGTFVVGTADVGAPLSIPGLTSTPVTPYAPVAAGVGASPYGAPYAGGGYGTPGYGATPSYGAPEPGAFSTSPAPDPSAAPVDASTAATEPQWDPQRNTHIQWDPARNCWLQWDLAAQEWRPIE